MMSKKSKTSTNQNATLKKVGNVGEITEYTLETNGLRVFFVPRPHTGVVTSSIMYKVGSRDEICGETGLAHMLEHMLFKPTHFDKKRKSDPGAMRFERETGCTLNAYTSRDRTNYYFSYPKEHFNRALQIEAERMHGVILTDAEFKPEQTNVLSEFDMYAGDELFTLSLEMIGIAFQSHPYGNEVIGYREDIEALTTEKLEAFYRAHYTPENATYVIVGDVTEKELEETILTHFKDIPRLSSMLKRREITEPKQQGIRTTSVIRPSETQVYGLGIKYAPFPTKEWFETMIIFDLLAGGEDSILHKRLVDTGLAARVQSQFEPSRDINLGMFFITLSKKTTHEKMHQLFLKTITELTATTITPFLKKTMAKVLTSEYTNRENSLGLAMELVEYASVDAVEQFFDSEKILMSITARDIENRIRELFNEDVLTIGYFIGKK